VRRLTGTRAVLAGALVSAGCVAVLLARVDVSQTSAALRRLDTRLLAIPLIVSLVNIAARAWRWRTIFPASGRPSAGACFSALAIGNMMNFVLPGRAGDVARCVLVGRDVSVSAASRGLATLVIEKVCDGLGLAALVTVAVWALAIPAWLKALLITAAVVFGGALAGLVAIRLRREGLAAAARTLSSRLGLGQTGARLQATLDSFADGLSVVGSPHAMSAIAALSAVILASEAALIWSLGNAFGLSLSAKSALVVSAVLGLGLMIPAAPGGLGTYELAGVAALQLVGVASATGLALTVAIHAWVFVTNTFLGLTLLLVTGLRPADLRRAKEGDPLS
jgi:uncharacterized protein (TIRG00374 family)